MSEGRVHEEVGREGDDAKGGRDKPRPDAGGSTAGSRLPLGRTAGFSFVPGAGIISDLKGRRCVLAPQSRRLTPHSLASSSSVWHADFLAWIQTIQTICMPERGIRWTGAHAARDGILKKPRNNSE
jgi:hypothetical protein